MTPTVEAIRQWKAEAERDSLRARVAELEQELRRADELIDEARASREIIANLRVALAMKTGAK